MLLTKANKTSLPALRATDGQGDEALAQVKFFSPWGSWTWYAMEFDPAEGLFFGLVKGDCPIPELGYFSLAELEAVRGPWGLKIERDRHFRPTPLVDLK